MSHAGSQQRTFLDLAAQLRPHWHRDRALPARIQILLARHRAFGSRDRRLYRELIYTALRYLPWVEPWLDPAPDFAARLVAWLAADTPATRPFRTALLTNWPPCPPTLVEKAAVGDALAASHSTSASSSPLVAADLLPAWFRHHCPEAFAPLQLDALLARAPLWLRLQTDDAARVTSEFDTLGWRWQRSPLLGSALRILDEVDITKTSAYASGRIEVQDLGSQLLLETAAVVPGGRWLDACAGAGGKTLQLARLLGSGGQVDAYDIRPAALDELTRRAARAGLSNIAVLRHAPVDCYDGVLVDAPCSGSGTWRRAPHLKWTTTAAAIEEAAALQRTLLAEASARVRPGGRLIYATCSLSRRENEDVAAAFLAAHPGFAAIAPAQTYGLTPRGSGLTFLPAIHDTDGFFVAVLRRA